MASEIIKKSPAEIELLQHQVYESALESFTSKYSWFEDADPALAFAEADLAKDKPKKDRTTRELAMIHLSDTITAVNGVVEDGLVKTPVEAEELSDALVYGQVRPSTAIKYLRAVGNTHLERTLSPRELASAVTLHSDLAYEDEDVSIATIVRAADATGVSLSRVPDEVDVDVILGSLESYNGKAEIHVIEDDPIEGPVGARKKIGVHGVRLAGRSEASVNAIDVGDKLKGAARVQAFVEDIAGIDDPDEIEDLYR